VVPALGRLNQEDPVFKSNLSYIARTYCKKKKIKKPKNKNPDVVEYTRNPSYSGGEGRRISNSRSPYAKLARPCLKNKIYIKGLGMWLE
jgi:hypothetical protein